MVRSPPLEFKWRPPLDPDFPVVVIFWTHRYSVSLIDTLKDTVLVFFLTLLNPLDPTERGPVSAYHFISYYIP